MVTFLCATLAMYFQPRAYRHPVTTWVPPYAVERSKTQLNIAGVKDALTHLDLQFWEPTTAGGVRLVSEPEVSEAAVVDLRDWAHSKGIRLMLCIFNGERKWDWPLAKSAFAENADAFVKNLLAEVVRLKLDGVDIDLEGPADYEADKPAYMAFMGTLSKALRALHLQLTVDSFCYIWNAPNQGWWNSLFPLVDGVNVMGYEDTGYSATEWHSYSSQKGAAGKNASKLSLGMLSDRAKWQGSAAQDQVDWVKNDGSMGVAIWDAQLRASGWQTTGLWQSLAAISKRK